MIACFCYFCPLIIDEIKKNKCETLNPYQAYILFSSENPPTNPAGLEYFNNFFQLHFLPVFKPGGFIKS